MNPISEVPSWRLREHLETLDEASIKLSEDIDDYMNGIIFEEFILFVEDAIKGELHDRARRKEVIKEVSEYSNLDKTLNLRKGRKDDGIAPEGVPRYRK